MRSWNDFDGASVWQVLTRDLQIIFLEMTTKFNIALLVNIENAICNFIFWNLILSTNQMLIQHSMYSKKGVDAMFPRKTSYRLSILRNPICKYFCYSMLFQKRYRIFWVKDLFSTLRVSVQLLQTDKSIFSKNRGSEGIRSWRSTYNVCYPLCV